MVIDAVEQGDHWVVCEGTLNLRGKCRMNVNLHIQFCCLFNLLDWDAIGQDKTGSTDWCHGGGILERKYNVSKVLLNKMDVLPSALLLLIFHEEKVPAQDIRFTMCTSIFRDTCEGCEKRP